MINPYSYNVTQGRMGFSYSLSSVSHSNVSWSIYGVMDIHGILSVLPYFLVAGIVGVFLWGFRERLEGAFGKKSAVSHEVSESSIDPRFAHLTVHYSNIRDTPDTENPARPRFVTDNGRKQAYWVSDLLEPYIRQHKICWFSYNGQRALMASLDRENYGIRRRAPLPEELGLSIDNDGSLKLAKVSKVESDLVSKLRDSKLEDLQVVFLERKRFRSLSARRTLLLKFSTKEAFLSPPFAPALVENGIVTSETYGMHRWQTCKCWCKRHGYTFTERHYPESELTKGL